MVLQKLSSHPKMETDESLPIVERAALLRFDLKPDKLFRKTSSSLLHVESLLGNPGSTEHPSAHGWFQYMD